MRFDLRRLNVPLLFLFLGALLSTATAQPQAASPSDSALTRGDRVTLLASPRFEDADLGAAYPVDLNGLRGVPLVDGPVTTIRDGTARTWFRLRTDDFRLQVAGTATGMVNRRVPGGNRRAAGLTIYKIDRVARLGSAGDLPTPDESESALLLSEIHYGWAFNIVIVGTKDTFTREVADQLRRRIDAGRPIEPLLRSHDLSPVVSSRGLGFGYRTPTPDRIPVTWKELEAAYDLGAPAPVLAEYTLLKDVRPTPIPWK